MATDSTNLPQGELTTDAGTDVAASELEFGAVQVAQVTADGEPVQMPQGQQVLLIPVQAGQTITLPTASLEGLAAKIGPEGNLAIVVDGRTIIIQGYVQANEQSPVLIRTNDGDVVDVVDVVAQTDQNLDIQTAAGPAAGAGADGADGSGIYTPFVAGPGLGGLEAIGVQQATELSYRLIDDEYIVFVNDLDTGPTNIEISFDVLGGVVNEDDLFADVDQLPEQQAAKLILQDQGNDGTGNDPFDGKDREEGGLDGDGDDGYPDADREPLTSVATVKVTFGPDIPGTLKVDDTELPTGLTSEGEPIVYQVLPPSGLQGNGVVAFVDKDGDGKFNELAGDRIVFDIKVQEKSSASIFHVAFTLYDNIDNVAPDANKDGASDLLGGIEEILDLPVKITATDKDGTPLSTVMHLGVEDDIPFFGQAEYTDGGEGGIAVIIDQTDADIVHDETQGVQWWDSDDQSFGDAGGDAIAATHKATDAGFSLPYGDSIGSLWPKGIAQTQIIASFGADGATQEHLKDPNTANTSVRNSIFGALQDRADGVIDDKVNGGDAAENERPFELFMIKSGSGINAVPTEDKLGTVANEGNLTIEDQPTNVTVSWTPWGGETENLQVFLRQIDAQTIVGYVIPPEGEENPPALQREVQGLENGLEAVFVITIDDDGKMTFVQYHQINHSVDGPTFPDHDDEFAIRGEDGTPVIQVRISDHDGDHATQPVNLVVQDDGPKFCGVDWGCDNDSKNGKGLIDEDKLHPNGNNDWAPGDDKGGKHADGKINFDFGVDKPGHVDVHGLKVTDSAGVVLLNITFSYDEATNTYTPSGTSDLKTADGHLITLEASLDEGTGLLTIIGRDSEDGSEAFVYTLQTTGHDKGEFDFCLNEPLYHPYTDSDSENDGPQKSFEDNLKFELNVRGYDVDGDYADGNICINVDDDSPKAECDYECVVEGTHGDGELNYVTGNIVTGDGNTIFGNDSNNLDGNADSPGADQPYTISKISHGGHTYELSEDGQSVSGLGAEDSFDAASGILTIKTAEGGTLEIVLVSDNQDEVGDYKYTVPANAQHDHDIEAGPANEAASMSDAFDTVGEWVDSFAAAGITLIPSGGALGLRDLDISGPAYRGIGVDNGNGDNAEVDNNGQNESLTLQIANPTNNIELTIGSLYNGAPDGGAMENLRWEVWNGGLLVDSGEILGTTTGLVTLDIDTLLPFDKVVLKPSDNGQGESANNSDFVLVNAEICCPTKEFTEKFDYTLRDADGDEACASLKVEVKDTEPKVPIHDILTWVNVDEDGLPKGIGNNDSPLDAPGNSASFVGNISFTPGADPVTIELSVVGGPETGLFTLEGEKVLATWDSATGTLIGYIEGTDPAVAANQVFTMQITDAQTGAFKFDLLQEVKHANTDDLGIFGKIDDTENLFDEFFLVKADIEDKDCDVASAIVKVVIDDDMPVITPHATVIVDEDALPNGIEGGPGDDGVIAASFNGNLGINFGADGGKSIAFSENGQPNLKSGGVSLQYTWVPAAGGLGTLIAHTGDVNNPVFKVQVTSLANGGEYTFTLLKPLDHPDSDNNPNNNNSDNGKNAYEDNLVFDLKFKATDGDGDTVDGKLKVNVDDDSPTIEPGSGSITLHTDETLGGSGDAAGGGTRIENDEAGASIPAVISGQVAGTVIGFSQGNAAGLFNDKFGADGPAASNSTDYALTILGGGVTGLTDTATGTAITLVAGANGVILGKANGGAGAVVFAFSVDDDGNVTMVQYRAVNHGAEESAPGVHDEVISFIQNALGVTQTIVDKDGDATSLTRDISTSISIDDDGPKANDDYDSVKEGPGNAATGNVVTGVNPENALLGTDGNGTDGNADNPGQDGPYTISKLTHDGQTYELSADGSSVSGLQPGDSYNSGTGVLTIQTAAGGVLEIVLKSSTQSEVGEYKYTPGAPIHAEDVHVGPSVAQSNTASFDNISEWTSAFTAGGITLSAQGGSLTIKTVDIAGPNDYRGVGITTGLDGSEVDTDNEKLTMTFDPVKFPGGVNNAEVQLGAFFDGVQFDNGSQEIVRWEAWSGNTLVASGQIVGDYDGLVTLDIDTATNFDKITLTPLNNGAGNNGNNSDFVVLNVEVCKQEPVCEEFGYTLRDGDGDESSATLKINVEDTQPTVPYPGCGTLSFIVDEDGIIGGNNNTDPLDADEGDAGNDDGKFSGNIPFTPGADPVTIELFVGEPGTPGGGDTGLNTWVGNSLKNVFAAWDAATGTLIGYIEGTDPSDAANRVFTMHVTNAQTGAFDFVLLKPVEHANTDAEGTNDNTENLVDRSFTVNVQIEDKDCDVAFTQVQVTIDDDMPVITQNTCGTIVLAVDESLDDNTSTSGGDDVPGGGTTQEDDEDHFTMPSPLNSLPTIGEAQASAAGLFTISYGADGPEDAEYSLVIKNGGVTGLIDTQSGTAIKLTYYSDSAIVGRNANGEAVFAFHINTDTGQISLAQYRAVNHGNEEPAPGVHDEVKTMASGILAVVVSVTDKDGDTVTAERDISGAVTFDDDGPKADIDIKHDAKIRIDESVGTDPSDSNAADENGSANPTDIGYAKVGANLLFDTSDSEFGTDGEASTDARQYKLLVNGNSDSGLDDTETNSNVLLTSNADGTLIEGKSAVGGHLVFTIAINPDTGEVTVTQYRAVEHNNDNDHDESNSPEIMDGNKVLVELTVTDGDGDKDTDTADLGSIIKFEDDGPKTDLQVACGAQIVLDESTGPAAADGYPDGNSNDEAGNVANDIAYAKVSGSSLFFDVTDFGSDKEGSTPRTYELELSNQDTSSGLTDTATGDPIYLHRISDTEIEGRVATSGSDPVAFRITINPANGEVTISQYRAVAHDNDGSSASDHDEASSPEIMDQNKLFVRLTVEDGDGDTASDKIDLGKLIKFEDDGPLAVADTDSVNEDGVEHAYGNVITGTNATSFGSDTNATDGNKDDAGTDGLQSIRWKDGGGFDGNGNIVGKYGTLYVDADGDYRYEVNNANADVNKLDNGQTLEDVFTYVITDKDGDTSTSTLKITINGKTDAFPPSVESATAFVDEDGLATGVVGGSGDDDADLPPDTVAGEAVFRDLTLPVNWNGNVGTIALSAGNWTGIKTIDGHDLAVGAGSTPTLLQIVDATTQELVLEVEIFNHTTGEYEVRLHKALSHPDSNNNSADDAGDFGNGSHEDNITVPVTVTYTNIAGPTASVININVDDDSPIVLGAGTKELEGDARLDDESSPLPGYTGIPGSEDGTDVPGAPKSTLVVVQAHGGADGGHSIVLDLSAFASANSALRATDGTSDGAAIAYTLEGGDVVARISEGNMTGVEVFRVHPQATVGQFVVTQNSAIFHTGGGESLPKNGVVCVKVIDNDGDAVSYQVGVAFTDDAPSVSTQGLIPTVVLDETRPVGSETDGNNAPAGLATHTVDFSGNFNAAFGADGAADTGAKAYVLELSGSDVPSGMYALTADGTGQGTPIVLNKVGDTIVGSANGNTYFTISVDGDGKVTFTQSQNVWHADTGNDDDASSLHTAAANALKLTLTIKDGDNDTDSASINLGHDVFQIEDDGPTAVNDNATPGTAASSTADIQFIVDVSGSMDGGVGTVDGFPDTRIGLARFAMFQLLTNHPEILNVQFVKFDDDVDSQTSLWLTREQALDYIEEGSNFVGGGNTNYDLALAEAINEYGNSVRPVTPPAPAAHQNLVYFLSDGAPNDGGGIQDGAIDPSDNSTGSGNVTREEWEAFATANNITNVFAIGIGDGVNIGNLEPVAFPNTDTNPADSNEDRVVLIPNSNLQNLTETLDALLGDVLTPVTGDVLANDNPGTDGYATPELVSVKYGAVTYTFGPGNTEYTIDLGAGRGSIKIDQDGDYTYTPPAADQADGTPFFIEYTIRDRDGDTSTAQINIDLTSPPTANNVFAAGAEDAPAGIAVVLTGSDTDGTIAQFKISSLPANGTLYADPALTIPLAVDGLVAAAGNSGTVYFKPNLNYNGVTTFNFTAIDNEGGVDATPATAEITVNPVNDGPDAVITAPSYAATEQTGLNLHGTGMSISDVDAGNGNVTVTLSVTPGTGTIDVVVGSSGVSGGNVSGSGTSSVTITGTLAQINNLLGGIDAGPGSAGTIVFNPSGGDNPPANTQLTLSVNDNGNTGSGPSVPDSAVVTINITNAPEAPVAGADRIYTNISSLITVQDSLLLKNDTDADTAHASLVVASATAGSNDDYFDTQPSHAGTNVSFEIDITGGSSFGNGTTKSFTYVVSDGAETGNGTVNVTYDTAGSIDGSNNDDILIGLNVGLHGDGGDDHMIGTGTTDLLDFSDVSSNWNLTLGAGGSGNANIDGADSYEGIDGIIGGSGNNELTGNALANTLNGNGGNDKLDGGNDAVADILNGGDGDDRLMLRTLDDTYNGGNNSDILDASQLAVANLSGFADSKIENVETLSLTGGGGTTVTLTAADVINFEGGSINPDGGKSGETYGNEAVLRITGEAGDTVNLNSGGSDNWFNATANGATGTPAGFTLWVHVTSGSNPADNEDAYVLVQNGVNVIPG